MDASDSFAGFERRNKKTITSFQVFLRYTDQKEKSSARLAAVLQTMPAGANILDIGAGNGEYLASTLAKLPGAAAHLTLIEPSMDLAKQLPARFGGILPRKNLTIISDSFARFSTDEQFDVVLAAHLFYHIPQTKWHSNWEGRCRC